MFDSVEGGQLHPAQKQLSLQGGPVERPEAQHVTRTAPSSGHQRTPRKNSRMSPTRRSGAIARTNTRSKKSSSHVACRPPSPRGAYKVGLLATGHPPCQPPSAAALNLVPHLCSISA